MTCGGDPPGWRSGRVALLLALVLSASSPAQEVPPAPPAPAAAPAQEEPPAPAGVQADVRGLDVGHWLRIKGHLREPGLFEGDEVEAREPADEESLLGTVEALGADGKSFTLLGQRVEVSARTTWEGADLDALPGQRIEVEGHWRGPGKFSARRITTRKPGRDRVEGRVDAIEITPKGVELRLMNLRVALPEATPVLAPVPLAELPRAQARLAQDARAVRDDDDQIADDTAITEQLSFGGQLEAKWEKRDEYDLDKSNPGDRVDRSASLRGEFTWEAEDGEAFGLFGFRGQWSDERRDGDVDSHSTDGVVTELYGYWRDPLGGGVDLQVGRQDFDEPREWLYDENLDALRAIWRGLGARLELSASTVRSDGSPKNREYDNLIAYLSNGDWHRHVAAYVIARSDHDGAQRDEPVHLGVRALGAWLPDQDVWLEASWLRGRADDDVERHGFGVDVGSTWEPGLLEPFYLTAGWARGSGDRDPDNSVDGSFLQTGLQDNNSKFGGVTSFRYYGEVLDPELANLQVYTLGVGVRPDPDVSVDLVWHGYAQPVPTPQLINTNLKQQPDGVHSQLGDGLDLIFGWRHGRRWDVEVVLGTFDPGAAFPGEDRAYLTSFQFRWRF